MGFFFKAKRGGAIASGIFFVLFFTLFSILGSVYLAVGVGNPVNKVTSSLTASESFKQDAGTYFVSKALESAKGDERALLLKKGPQISGAVTTILSNPILKQLLDGISNTAYTYYMSGNKSLQTIDVKPLANLALIGLESVDPQFKQLKKELDKIKPIKLQPQKSGPDVGKINSDVGLALLILLLLTAITKVLYARFAKSLMAYVRTIGIVLLSEGVVLILLHQIAGAVISHQASTATETLVREAIPIAAHPLLSPILTIGLLEFLFGATLLGLSFVRRLRVKESGYTPS
jgi:hypothetical protein